MFRETNTASVEELQRVRQAAIGADSVRLQVVAHSIIA